MATEASKDTTAAAQQADNVSYDQLLLSDNTDLADTYKGLIVPPSQDATRGEQGNAIWNPQQYAFIKEGDKAPDTVNPDLQRQSQLINISRLFGVTDGTYQIRNLDLPNMTIIEGREGIAVVDSLISAETVKAGMDLYFKNRGQKLVVAVICTHNHVDHYGDVRGVVDKADVRAGRVKVYVPAGFIEAVITENTMAGNVMSRCASYMYDNLLKPDTKSQIGAGLGTTAPVGTVTPVTPTNIIEEDGQREVIDDLTYGFMLAPGPEAPLEMLWHIEKKKLIESAEGVIHALHNIYSLRRVKIREPLPWSKRIGGAIVRRSDKAEVLMVQHYWPAWGNDKVVSLLESQCDLYHYINDQTLRTINEGLTRDKIAADSELSDPLAHIRASRGHYGFVSHDVKVAYVLYLGQFDGNPVTLDELLPEESAEGFVDYMGDTDAVLQKAKVDYDQGNYHWMVQAVSRAVSADLSNQATRSLEVDTLE